MRKRILIWIEGRAPITVYFSAAIVGVLLLLGGSAAHLMTFSEPEHGRLFGYVAEINWGLNYVLPIPVALFFATATINAMSSTIGALARSSMFVESDNTAIDETTLLGSWRAYGASGVGFAGVLCLIALVVSMQQWASVCLLPALSGTAVGLQPGWNIAWKGTEHAATPEGTAIFGFFAFLAQAGVASAFLLFATLVVTFAQWIYDYTKDTTAMELFPTPRSEDRRRGFEQFAPLIENLLMSAVMFFFVFLMTRLDSLYVFSDAGSIKAFLLDNILLQGLAKAVESRSGWLFDPGNVLDISATLVAAGLCLVGVLAFLVPSNIVRQAAKRSQQRFLTRLGHTPEPLAALYNIPPDEALEKINAMDFWPIRYPKQQLLLVFVAFAAICFVCYRLTLSILAMAFFYIVRKALTALDLWPKKMGKAGAPAKNGAVGQGT